MVGVSVKFEGSKCPGGECTTCSSAWSSLGFESPRSRLAIRHGRIDADIAGRTN